MTTEAKWRRVNKASPCPVCDHDSHCTISPDGAAVRCKRTKSDREAHGEDGEAWIHRLNGHEPSSNGHAEPAKAPGKDWGAMARRFAEQITDEQVTELATSLQVDPIALRELGIGFDGGRWMFPMYAADGSVCGIKGRAHDGEKKALTGANLGVHRRVHPDDGMLLICEGESDTAAALTLGFDAIGLPSASNAIDAAAAYTRGRDVVIVADDDEPGLRSATKLAAAVAKCAASVRTIRAPGGHKDLRAARVAGISREDVEQEIAATKPTSLGPIADAWAPLPEGLLSTPPVPRTYALRWAEIDGKKHPPRQGPGFASGGVVGVLSASGGTGKSIFLLLAATCIVLGRRFLWFDVGSEFAGRRCCLLFGEETLAESHRRLWQIAKFLRLDEADRRELERKLVILPMHGKTCGLIVPGENGALPKPTAAFEQLRQRLHATPEPWGLVALDPQSRTLPGSEGGNDAATHAVQIVEQLTEAPGSPLVLISAHSSKKARANDDVDARGVTGLTDAARLHFTLKKVRKGAGKIEFAAPKSNYGADLDAPLILRLDEETHVPRVATDAELAGEEQAGEASAEEQVAADAKLVVEALRIAGSAKSIDKAARLAGLGKRRGRPCVKYAIEEGWIDYQGPARDRVLCVCDAPPHPPAGAGARSLEAPGAGSASDAPGVDGASMGRRGAERKDLE